MDIEALEFRSNCIKKIRQFFDNRNYLELDTPALSPTLIPETCLEVFETQYIPPENSSIMKEQNLYLVPSPEIYIKKLIAEHKRDVFQVSKCYRNTESTGRIHSPEFTMLEYYTMNKNYIDSLEITEALFTALLPPIPINGKDPFEKLRPPFIRLTMDDAFERFAGFRLSDCNTALDLAKHAAKLGLYTEEELKDWQKDELYELILVNNVEPCLNLEKPVFLLDYPSFVPCLAKDKSPMWKERWELYAKGIELANCYSEETNAVCVKEYFEIEGALKNKTARVPHALDNNYWKTFVDFPECSGVAMGVDRFIAVLGGYGSLEPILY